MHMDDNHTVMNTGMACCSFVLCFFIFMMRKLQIQIFFFFKQKTAYEMIWCWSSDVCSSDLRARFYARPKSYASEGCLTQAGCQKIFKDKASAGHTARPGWAKTLEM